MTTFQRSQSPRPSRSLLPICCLDSESAVDRDGQLSENTQHATLAQSVEQLIRNQ